MLAPIIGSPVALSTIVPVTVFFAWQAAPASGSLLTNVLMPAARLLGLGIGLWANDAVPASNSEHVMVILLKGQVNGFAFDFFPFVIIIRFSNS